MRNLILIAALTILPTSVTWSQQWNDVTATVYNADPRQCNADYLTTASGSRIDTTLLKDGKLRWIAVSRDLLDKYPYGTSVYLWISEGHPKNGSYKVKDTMNKRYTNCIDILTYNERHGKWKAKIQKNP